jgi:hypothetical protein
LEVREKRSPRSLYLSPSLASLRENNDSHTQRKLYQAKVNRWSVNQYINYQSWHSHTGSNNSNGDLFIDYHPPKSLQHFPAIKANSLLLRSLTGFVCQIYSGLFNFSISKNLLLVNSPHSPKGGAYEGRAFANSYLEGAGNVGVKTTLGVFPLGESILTSKMGPNNSNAYNLGGENQLALLIRALAGETELKIITDNAHRYALVNRGFAIGIKLLREVFDAIALNTPCIFLLEDIHAIGERRPMLISDFGGGPQGSDDTSSSSDFFGNQCVAAGGHDADYVKNIIVYQLTRHALTHYKKPFKGDYSLAIPTNLFVNNINKVHSRGLEVNAWGNSTFIQKTLKNKIPSKIKLTHGPKGDAPPIPLGKASLGGLEASNKLDIKQGSIKLMRKNTRTSSPKIAFALKEERQFKHSKIVESLPWTSLPSEQLATKPRTLYSIRAKVAMLAERALSNSGAKLDMITDLLVIIDSVRSNKGFVVFATTDVPHVLDPALRRPGRLDETICLPGAQHLNSQPLYSPNTVSNFVFTSLSLAQRLGTPFDLPSHLSKGKGRLAPYFASPVSPVVASKKAGRHLRSFFSASLPKGQQARGTATPFSKGQGKQVAFFCFAGFPLPYGLGKRSPSVISGTPYQKNTSLIQSNMTMGKPNLMDYNLYKKKNNIKALAYYEGAKRVLVSNSFGYLGTPTSSFDNILAPLLSIPSSDISKGEGKVVLGPTRAVRLLINIFAGKISQMLCSTNPSPNLTLQHSLAQRTRGPRLLNLDNEVKIATEIYTNFVHKRFLYSPSNKGLFGQDALLSPKLLSFTDGNVLEEPPSPPFSSLLLPAKRFENYQRVFQDMLNNQTTMGQRKAEISWGEILQYHKQLSSIKILNVNKDLYPFGLESERQGFTPVEGVSGIQRSNLGLPASFVLRTKKQSKSSLSQPSLVRGEKQLGLNKLLEINNLNKQNPTNINWYYQNRILKRHGQYLTNQWWNGQLSEHNAETVFLSNIDWRSSFIKNKRSLNLLYDPLNTTNKRAAFALPKGGAHLSLASIRDTKGTHQSNYKGGLDVLLDFPDTDQYYNPCRRRWFLTKGYWSFGYNLDKAEHSSGAPKVALEGREKLMNGKARESIIKIWILECINQGYTYLYNNTELLDYITSKIIGTATRSADAGTLRA